MPDKKTSNRGSLFILTRTFFDKNHISGIFAVINEKKEIIQTGVTLELPYLNNQRNISAIPTGTYRASLLRHVRLGKTIYIHSVVGRTGIFIHTGNYVDEIRGCILAGNYVSSNEVVSVLNSKDTLSKLNKNLNDNFEVRICSIS